MTTEAETETSTVTILAGRADEAFERVKKFTKKAKKYGVPFSVSFSKIYQEERWIEDGYDFYTGSARQRKVKVDVLDLTIVGETPKVGNYEFLASIELGDGGNYVDTVPGVDLDPKFRTAEGHCEHCNATRRRKHVYAIRSRDTGEVVQVGRTCLRDYLGIDDPKHILAAFRFWRSFNFSDDEEGWRSLGRVKWSASLVYLLSLTNASIRIWGWTSKGQARHDEDLTPTAGRIMSIWGDDKYSKEEARQIKDEMKESDEVLAEKIVAWVRASDNDNDYFHNLRMAFRDDLLWDGKRIGLAISAVSAWHRDQEIQLKRAKRQELNVNSVHVGALKERLKGVQVRLEERRGMGDQGWGWTELLKFRDETGNLFTWFTGSAPAVDIGQDMIVDGTVKGHRDFNGVMETQLNRVTVREILHG